MTKMTDAEVRAELEQLNDSFVSDWDQREWLANDYVDSLRRVAESRRALGEIADMKMRVATVVTLSTDGTGEEREIEGYCDSCHKIKKIARAARKGK